MFCIFVITLYIFYILQLTQECAKIKIQQSIYLFIFTMCITIIENLKMLTNSIDNFNDLTTILDYYYSSHGHEHDGLLKMNA